MKKRYMNPRMEVMEMKMLGVIAGSSVEKISGDLGYTGGSAGGGRAPMMPDFEEFEGQFDFTNIKLW